MRPTAFCRQISRRFRQRAEPSPHRGEPAAPARTFGGHPDPVEVAGELLGHVGLAARGETDHHDQRRGVGHVGSPCCQKKQPQTPKPRSISCIAEQLGAKKRVPTQSHPPRRGALSPGRTDSCRASPNGLAIVSLKAINGCERRLDALRSPGRLMGPR